MFGTIRPSSRGREIMHKLMAGSTILEHELSELRLLVERQTGLMLDCPNSALAAHVIEYLETHELDSAVSLLDRLRPSDQDATVLPQFLEGLLNANTGFFRHPTAMNALTRQVLPQLFARKSGEVPGTRAVLEVRSHEVPFLVEDGQVVGRLIYERLTDTPEKLYGTGLGSSYQRQGLALSKHFKRD